MATATIKKLPDEPIVIVTLSGSSAELIDSEQLRVELRSTLNAASEPVFLITDLSDSQISFDEILRGSSGAYRGDNPTFKHPNIRQIIEVTNDPTLELVAEGLDSDLFGNVKIRLFKTLKEALAYARATR